MDLNYLLVRFQPYYHNWNLTIIITENTMESVKSRKVMGTPKLLCLLVIPMFLNINGCERSVINNQEVSPCLREMTDGYDIVGELVNVEGEVITLPNLFPNGQFFIQVKSSVQNLALRRLPLGACNLPKDFQRVGTRIKFSGRLLWYKTTEGIAIDVSTQPFELTQISNLSSQE